MVEAEEVIKWLIQNVNYGPMHSIKKFVQINLLLAIVNTDNHEFVNITWFLKKKEKGKHSIAVILIDIDEQTGILTYNIEDIFSNPNNDPIADYTRKGIIMWYQDEQKKLKIKRKKKFIEECKK